MHTWNLRLAGAVLLLNLWLARPGDSLAQDAAMNNFSPDVVYDIYVESEDANGLVIRQVNIIGVTQLNGKTLLIIQPKIGGNNVHKGYVLLDRVAAILSANGFSVKHLNI